MSGCARGASFGVSVLANYKSIHRHVMSTFGSRRCEHADKINQTVRAVLARFCCPSDLGQMFPGLCTRSQSADGSGFSVAVPL